MKVALIQFAIKYGRPNANYERVETEIKQAVIKGASVIVLPELWNTGFDLKRLDDIADVDGERTKRLLSRLSKELGIYIVGGSVAIKKEGLFYNTMYVTNIEGEIISAYDKVHLFSMTNEHHYLTAGDQLSSFLIEDVPMAGVICYDIRFPEWMRRQVVEGAKLIFVPAQWPGKRIDHWKILLQARAIENQCFVIAVNSMFNHQNKDFSGQSMVISPTGEVLWTGKDVEETGVVDIQLDTVDQVRSKMSIFDDRRISLYLE